MKPRAIISRGESLQILKNDLRNAALEKRAAEYRDATEEKREAILTEIEREIETEIRRRKRTIHWDNLIW